MNFLERIKSIFKRNKIKALPSESTDAQKITLLATHEKDPEKVLEILRNNVALMKSVDIVQIISHLPMKCRIEAIEITHKLIDPFDLAEFALKKMDCSGKVDILQRFQNKLSLDDIYSLLNSIPPDQRLNALKKCTDRFDSFSIAEIINNYIPLYEKLDALKLYSSKIEAFAKVIIIKSMDTDRKILALELYAKDINSRDLKDIVCEVEKNKRADVFNVVYNYLSDKQIEEIITEYIPENRRLEMLYKSCYKLNSATISDLIKYSIPHASREEALVALQNRMEKNNVGEVFQFCSKSLDILRKIQHNLYEEDVEYFTKNIK